MRRTRMINERHLTAVLIISSSILCLLLGFISFQKALMSEGIVNFSARSENRSIQLSWNCINPYKHPIELVIESEETIRKVELPYYSKNYEFLDGQHGGLYKFTLSLEERSDKETAERLFLDWDQLPELPLVTIETVNGKMPSYTVITPEEHMWGASICDNDYVAANVTIWNQAGTELEVVGEVRYRGNTSAVYSDKRSYAIQLNQASDLLGRNDKRFADENWILLPGHQSLTTDIGMYISKLCGLEWQPAYIPVNLLFNGDWMGQYYLIESVKKSTGRVNIGQDGFLIENNAYWWKPEEVYFKTPNQIQQLGYTFKYPDAATINEHTKNDIMQYMTLCEEAILSGNGSFTEYIDVNSFCRWLLTHDILGNEDGAGSNIYLYKYSLNDDSLLKLGPAWDFDAIFITDNAWSEVHSNPDILCFSHMLEIQQFREAYLKNWNSISGILCKSVEDYLESYADQYGGALQKSWDLESTKYHMKKVSMQDVIDRVVLWFHDRKDWMDEAVINP